MPDNDLFESEMSDVTPLKRSPRERLVKTDSVDASLRRQSATRTDTGSDNVLTDEGLPRLAPGVA